MISPCGRINHNAFCTNRICRKSPPTARMVTKCNKSLLASVTPPNYMPGASAVIFLPERIEACIMIADDCTWGLCLLCLYSFVHHFLFAYQGPPGLAGAIGEKVTLLSHLIIDLVCRKPFLLYLYFHTLCISSMTQRQIHTTLTRLHFSLEIETN